MHGWHLHANRKVCDFQQRHEDFLDRKRENSLVSAFHCFRRVATRKQAYIGHICHLEAVLEALAEKINRSLQRSCINKLSGWIGHDRMLEGLHYERSVALQRRMTLRRWHRHSRHIQNKRGVHLFCDRYCNARLLQYGMLLWQEVHIRMRSVANAVITWIAECDTMRASRALLAWNSLTDLRRKCRENAVLLITSRRKRVFQNWDFAIEDKLEAVYAAKRASLACVSSRLATWYAMSKRRRRGKIATEAVVKARQRRWIEQWSSSGRWDRLQNVAKSWDEKVRGNRCLSEAFWMWQDIVLTIFRAGVAADRVGKLHALLHFRSWRDLWRKLSQANARIREKKVTRALSSWRHFSKTSQTFQRKKERVGLDRQLTRPLSIAAISRFDSYCGERRRRRIGDRECVSTIYASRSKLRSRGALSWWRKWSIRHKDKLADKIETIQGKPNGQEQWERFCDIVRPRDLQVRDPLKLATSSLRDFLEIHSLKEFVLPPASENRVLRLKGVPFGTDVAEVDRALAIYHIGQTNIALCRAPGHHATSEAIVVFPSTEAAQSAVEAENSLQISGKHVEFAACVNDDVSAATSRISQRSSFEILTKRVRSIRESDPIGDQMWCHYCESTRRGSYDPTQQPSEFLSNYLDAYTRGKLSVKLQMENGRVQGRRVWLKEVQSTGLAEDVIPQERY